jgi:type IV pilus assembly protein PilO
MYLTEVNFERIIQWPSWLKWCGGLILFLFILGLGYRIVLAPSTLNYEALEQEESMLNTRLSNRQQQALHFEDARQQLLRARDYFNKLLKQFPLQDEMPSLLEDISKTGLAQGLIFELFAPQVERSQGVYKELSIRLVLIGKYHQIANFITQLAQMNRLVTVHDFVLSVYSPKQLGINTHETTIESKLVTVKPVDLLRMSLLVKVYWATKGNSRQELGRRLLAGLS